jgi:hypothetical protein
VVLENLFYLALFHSGIYKLLRKSRGPADAEIVFPPAVATGALAAQFLAIAKYYQPIDREELVRRLRSAANEERREAIRLRTLRTRPVALTSNVAASHPMEMGSILVEERESEAASARQIVGSFPNPLWLMMEIEGCSVRRLGESFRKLFSGE